MVWTAFLDRMIAWVGDLKLSGDDLRKANEIYEALIRARTLAQSGEPKETYSIH